MIGKENNLHVAPLRLPSDVLTVDSDLFNRAKESVEKSTLLPLLKDELRCKIQTKRMSQGLDELRVDFQIKPQMPLSEEEKRKQDQRKCINRRSAKVCREKKKTVLTQKQQELQELTIKNHDLKEKIRLIEAEKEFYLSSIVEHPTIKNALTELLQSNGIQLTEVVYQQN